MYFNYIETGIKWTVSRLFLVVRNSISNKNLYLTLTFNASTNKKIYKYLKFDNYNKITQYV